MSRDTLELEHVSRATFAIVEHVSRATFGIIKVSRMSGRGWLLALVVAVLVAGGGGYAVMELTRGLRNNNPGNIRRSSDTWQGLRPEQTDPDYFQFVDPIYGLRAIARILLNYRDRYGLDTVAKIITRWSPPSENPTRELIDGAAQRLGVNANQTIDVRAWLPQLVAAIVRQENGVQPYSDETIRRAVGMV